MVLPWRAPAMPPRRPDISHQCMWCLFKNIVGKAQKYLKVFKLTLNVWHLSCHTNCEAATTVAEVTFEDFRDFSSSQYAVTIARAQQIALQSACAPVPLPSTQLDLANAKKSKESRKHHRDNFINFWDLSLCSISFVVWSILVFGECQLDLRQYISVEMISLQDGWKVDVRKRLQGKHKGGIYHVYINPQGRQRMTLILDFVYITQLLFCTCLHVDIIVIWDQIRTKEGCCGRWIQRSWRSCQSCSCQAACLSTIVLHVIHCASSLGVLADQLRIAKEESSAEGKVAKAKPKAKNKSKK